MKIHFPQVQAQMLLCNGIQYIRILNLRIFRIYIPLKEFTSNADKLFSGSIFFSISPIFVWLISIYINLLFLNINCSYSLNAHSRYFLFYFVMNIIVSLNVDQIFSPHSPFILFQFLSICWVLVTLKQPHYI